MRFLVKISFPVEAANEAARKNNLAVIRQILEEQKPEAAYFIADGGRRTAVLITDLAAASDIPALAEPWFLALNASIEATPAMLAADLEKAAPAIERAVKMYG
jgi:hypothetical protein